MPSAVTKFMFPEHRVHLRSMWLCSCCFFSTPCSLQKAKHECPLLLEVFECACVYVIDTCPAFKDMQTHTRTHRCPLNRVNTFFLFLTEIFLLHVDDIFFLSLPLISHSMVS